MPRIHEKNFLILIYGERSREQVLRGVAEGTGAV